jgi:CSLREA domain-containing protein
MRLHHRWLCPHLAGSGLTAYSRFCSILLTALFALAISSGPSMAVTFTVNSTADLADSSTTDLACDAGGGVCTLRAAIQQANYPIPLAANTINVPAGTYLLSSGNLTITKSLTIVGTGAAGTVIIDGQNTWQIFNLPNGAVTLTNLVLQHGIVTVANAGNCVGGGILAAGATPVNINSSIIQNNAAVNGSGGGICVLAGTVNLDRSTVRNNTSTYGGAGIRIQTGTLNVTNSTFNGNTASDSNASGTAIRTQSTVNVTNSTISGNTLPGTGSGIAVVDGTTTLRNVTITGNGSAPQLSVFNATAVAILESTIIANPNGGANCNTFSGGVITSNGHNLDSANSCGFAAAGDLINSNPLLGALQNNGGPTATHALGVGSPAINAGSNPSALAFDQRGPGFPRVSGVAADIGAFEVENFTLAPILFLLLF